jgi:hypothetical protein
MNKVSVSISTKYDSKPPYCRIYVCDNLIFDSTVDSDLELKKDIGHFDRFKVTIIKTGKTLDLIKNNHKQEINIENINLNGIDLKVKAFGMFRLEDNLYVENKTLQTDQLHLNGEWNFELPERTISGDVSYRLNRTQLRNDLQDCDIACFGCSQTWGIGLPPAQTWPAMLAKIAKRKVMNYGMSGSNINEITAFVEHYLKNHKTNMILIYLPHTFRRLIKENEQWERILTLDPKNKDLVLHGEAHSVAVLSGHLHSWFQKVQSITKVYFSTYHSSEYQLMKKTKLEDFMMPFLDNHGYPKSSDGLHHGESFNDNLAKNFANFLDLG